ncbi:hypothetical protein MLD38_024023 [Melastoma candidum]|uniref:Uncharacterized protein n=1 Tax=Melastoma candidum TaxID=119954 RepID=A0ACB9NRX0_9MYRT|nr:hypothetical protein MLD38_024023 [Melastoma candidum]
MLPLFLILFHSTVAASASATTATLTLQLHDPNTRATSTIPAFPEQSASSPTSSCPLSLPLRRPPSSLRPSCTPSPHHRLRCCPTLATLLFSSYPSPHPSSSSSPPGKQGGYDMPEVPQDTETCSEEVGKALTDAGVDVSYRNASCDLVFCYCGIHLHRMSCEMDDRVFNDRVGSLARDCSSPGIAGCSRCLTSLSKLRSSTALLSSNDGERTTKVHSDDCQLMGLAWLLARNHSAYARTVTSVFRAMMSGPDGTVPRSCKVRSDVLPLAVDSSELSGNWTPTRGWSAPWRMPN